MQQVTKAQSVYWHVGSAEEDNGNSDEVDELESEVCGVFNVSGVCLIPIGSLQQETVR
jgi:hypothetical protein